MKLTFGMHEKSIQAPEGSYEDLICDLNSLVNPDWDDPNYDWRTYTQIIGTFSDYLITCVWDADGVQTYWKIPYTIGDNKEPILGDNKEELEIDFVPVGTGSYSDADDDDDMEVSQKEIDAYVMREKAGSGSDLPDSAFAYVEPGHKVDGKTPNKYRHFRIDDKKHVRLAVQLLDTSEFGDKARSKVMAAARRHGIKIDKKKAESSEKEQNGLNKIKSTLGYLLNGFIGGSPVQSEIGNHSALPPMMMTKDADGRLRFFSWFTSNVEDGHDETIAANALKEMADHFNSAKVYPSMWVWHTAGTEWGQVDWMDSTGGVAVASGLVTPGKEAMAERLCEMGADLGFSHGFVGLKTKEGVWTKVRTYEISALPRRRAANKLTGPLELFTTKESEMALTPERRAMLLDLKMSENEIADVEKTHDAFIAAKEALAAKYGLSTKAQDDPKAGDGTNATGALFSEITEMKGIVTRMVSKMDELATIATGAKEMAENASTSLADAIKSQFSSSADPAKGTTAASVKSNDDPSNPAAQQIDPNSQAAKDAAWFMNAVGPLMGAAASSK